MDALRENMERLSPDTVRAIGVPPVPDDPCPGVAFQREHCDLLLVEIRRRMAVSSQWRWCSQQSRLCNELGMHKGRAGRR
eukprot:jgi/Tetstr1/425900/TSEL_016271.t1